MKLFFYLLLLAPFFAACTSSELTTKSDDELKNYSKQLAQNILIIDTHLDTPMSLMEGNVDFSQSLPNSNFDYPRAKAGGLKVPFWAAFVSSEFNNSDKAKVYADSIITAIEKFIDGHNDKFQRVKSSEDVLENYRNRKVLIATGVENGAAIEDNLSNIKHFYDRGIKYITLTHNRNNKICDSSFDPERKWNGLSPFGIEVVKEMNRVGVIIDVSHVSDSTFYQVLRLTKVPVVATHSSCRYFTPGLERNMSDEMIKLLAKNGGVIQINFGSSFLSQKVRNWRDSNRAAIDKYLADNKLKPNDPAAVEFTKRINEEHPTIYADVKDLAAHIDHVRNLVGIDYVGIGSDFDGLGDSLPTGLKDVSGYPNLIYELLKLGYSEEDIQKVMGGNFMRVWHKVEKGAEL